MDGLIGGAIANHWGNYGAYYVPLDWHQPSGWDRMLLEYQQGLGRQQAREAQTHMKSIKDTSFIVVKGSALLAVCDTHEEAQAQAEEVAHKEQGSVYVFKPCLKVQPKRDVTVTSL